jgi:hypothetical protein
MSSKFQNLAAKPQSSRDSIRITAIPSIIQILPVKIQIPQTVEIYQITVKFEYKVGENDFTDYVVFERSAAASDSAWRICGRIIPNSGYF